MQPRSLADDQIFQKKNEIQMGSGAGVGGRPVADGIASRRGGQLVATAGRGHQGRGHGQSVPLPPLAAALVLASSGRFLPIFHMHQRAIFKPDRVNNITWFLSGRNGLVIVGGVCRCCHQAITVSADHFSYFFLIIY